SGQQNTFLNSANGLSIIGYWGNQQRSSVLFLDPDARKPNHFDSLWPDRPFGDSPPPGRYEWRWNVGQANDLHQIYLAADIDGDGLVDAVSTDNSLYFTVKDAQAGGLQHLYPLNTKAKTSLPNLLIANPDRTIPAHPSVLVDMNGDGIPD